jgi:hypothetical protein
MTTSTDSRTAPARRALRAVLATTLALAACAPHDAVVTDRPVRFAGVESSGATNANANANTNATVTVASSTPTPALVATVDPLSDERVNAEDPLPDAPPEPVTPTALEPRVRELRATAARTGECWSTEPYMRIAHAPPAQCETWFDALARGGEASGYAIGQSLAENTAGTHEAPMSRLAAVLAALEARPGVAFLLRRMHAAVSPPPAAQRSEPSASAQPAPWLVFNLVNAFERASGFPVNDHPVQANMFDGDARTKARPMVIRALRWWERAGSAHGSWASTSEQRLRAWLAADDTRAIRAAFLIAQRPSSAQLVGVAREALERVQRDTTSAEARSTARSALQQLSNDRARPTLME